MDLKLIGDKKTIMVKINAELDHHAATEIRKAVDSKIKSSNAVNVIFDFSKVDFMDSSGIGVIMGRYKLIKSLGGEITVTNINQSIDRIFTISGLYKLVNKTVTPSLTNI